MDISEVSSLDPSLIQTMFAVKCFKATQESMAVAGNIIEDVAQISAEALNKYQAEANQ